MPNPKSAASLTAHRDNKEQNESLESFRMKYISIVGKDKWRLPSCSKILMNGQFLINCRSTGGRHLSSNAVLLKNSDKYLRMCDIFLLKGCCYNYAFAAPWRFHKDCRTPRAIDPTSNSGRAEPNSSFGGQEWITINH